MKKHLLKIFMLSLLVSIPAQAQMIQNEQVEPASIESKHVIDKKIDSTGGIQLPSSFNLYNVNKTLDDVRGPDLFGKCAYYDSSVTDPDFCQKLQNAYPNGK